MINHLKGIGPRHLSCGPERQVSIGIVLRGGHKACRRGGLECLGVP